MPGSHWIAERSPTHPFLSRSHTQTLRHGCSRRCYSQQLPVHRKQPKYPRVNGRINHGLSIYGITPFSMERKSFPVAGWTSKTCYVEEVRPRMPCGILCVRKGSNCSVGRKQMVVVGGLRSGGENQPPAAMRKHLHFGVGKGSEQERNCTHSPRFTKLLTLSGELLLSLSPVSGKLFKEEPAVQIQPYPSRSGNCALWYLPRGAERLESAHSPAVCRSGFTPNCSNVEAIKLPFSG